MATVGAALRRDPSGHKAPPTAMSSTRANFHDLTRDELRALAVRWGFSPVHAGRLWRYAYVGGLTDWRQMLDGAELDFTGCPVPA